MGLTAETLLLAPPAPAGLLWLGVRGESAFLASGTTGALWVVASGVVTALPLLWFANAARLLRYVTLGFFQYLAPTGQFLLAVFAFGERFTSAHAIAFAFIWTALVLYALDAARAPRVVAGSAVDPRA